MELVVRADDPKVAAAAFSTLVSLLQADGVAVQPRGGLRCTVPDGTVVPEVEAGEVRLSVDGPAAVEPPAAPKKASSGAKASKAAKKRTGARRAESGDASTEAAGTEP